MAYNAVAQIDHEVASNSSSASRSPSPTHGHAFERLPLDTDHIGGGSHLEPAQTTDKSTFGLGSMIRSIASTNYDVVEDDEYDADPAPEEQSTSHQIPPLNTRVSRHSSPEPPLHSACSDVPVPLSHPTPDLQSIQGAYKGNVTRLEESAEQLSLCSTDIESEIRRIDREQKRRSVSSVSNSIHRNGAFSPAVTVSSAHASNVSPARQRSVSGTYLPYVSEPAHEVDEFPGLPDLPPSQPMFDGTHDHYYDQYNPQGIPEEAAMERRASVASNDTYQQARTLFTDFDGVHFTPRAGIEPGRQVSLDQPPLARKPQHHHQPQEGENMVYYPAPVPRMLNLPPKLSQRSNTDRDRRRTQLAGVIAAENRKSALLGSDEPNVRNDKRKSTVPAHLRASVFFDQPSTSLHVEARQDSAVTTLDSILDASANAPVSAFTDHPYAGHVGSYIYNKSKRKTLTKDPAAQKTNRLSQFTMGQHNDNLDKHGGPSRVRPELEAGENSDLIHDEHIHGRGHGSSDGSGTESAESSEDEEDSEGELDYVGPPNTLIAELELRKIELKHRRRTAVPVPFHGMQSTLLEMDEIAQKQSDKRRQRPVALAWEGRDEDEDVPLAMLYPEKVSADDDDRPLGLIEKQQQEENEPLSSRRARLRGEPAPKPAPRPATVYTVEPSHVPDVAAESDGETEVETLAQRVARLKGHTRSESQFAAELMAEIDTRAGVTPTGAQEAPGTNEEETLAQRRSRLQKEAAAQRKDPRARRSMAALTQGRGRPAQLSRQSSHDVFGQRPVIMSRYGNRLSMQQFPPQMGYGMATGYPIAPQYGYPVGYPAGYANPAMGGMLGGYASNMARPTGPLSTGPLSTDVIDRWRQSIR
ncbi:uncharacterized protein N7515_003434 [Penicillium bovifimosum]|uniref:Uncharacterized protein n=1 Tax=Penicillium bovifimosum TaxID=126998 RepID=A0A9W9L5S0_9EURO|nr:uncharacterized protein N7515_003434 [Penicillium bovifimosum]KAJ5138586.1 hypothetical protein N7515_003434 [Penicillium bovifimosum]